VVTLETIAERHRLVDEELALYAGLFEHLVKLGVLSVVRPSEKISDR
jgi:hypothetical protein